MRSCFWNWCWLVLIPMITLQPSVDAQGLCSNLGLNGCCTTSSCSPDGLCYCDVGCYILDDCCEDIEAIGCFSPPPPTTAPPSGASCVELGFTECCPDGICRSEDGTCHCDQICHLLGDCCDDIAQIGCFPPSDNTAPSFCVDLGLSDCCNGTSCGVLDERCSCDQGCHSRGDCCPDINEIGCFPPAETASCVDLGLTSCCTEGPCISMDSSCMCDQDCYERNDCCSDISAINCAQPEVDPSSSCVSRGFTRCCVGTSEECSSADGNCFCDQFCHNTGDCCEDISAISCFPIGFATPFCEDRGLTSCCNGTMAECAAPDGTCYCDQACHTRGDCCSDINMISCYAPIPDPTPFCADLGLTTCCNSSESLCISTDESCFCDAHCHIMGDCCADILDINCTRPEPTPFCADLGISGCCNGTSCNSTDGSCYCDQNCYTRGDCCRDISAINCFERVVTAQECKDSLTFTLCVRLQRTQVVLPQFCSELIGQFQAQTTT